MASSVSGQAQKNIEMILQVTGRSTEKLTSAKCGNFTSTCYVTPIQGTGTAGKNCAMYKPNVTIQSTYNVDQSLTNNLVVDQVNYSCNWNKLIFGSGQTDRVAIPLYYDNSGATGTAKIVNPYKDGTAKNFMVRLRTPCKPCAPAGTTSVNTDSQRTCDATVKDETVCKDEDRYVLDTGTNNNGDDIVVQWLINGECDAGGGKMETCGMTPIADKVNLEGFSSLYESRIYANNAVGDYNFSSPLVYKVIENSTLAFDTNAYPNQIIISNKLSQMIKPVFTLFLNKPLLTKDKNNIPYLEYQVLTDSPVGNSKSSLDVIVNVEGNNFRKTLTQDVQKALIDFAIHN